MTPAARNKIVQTALEWLGTPWVPNAALRGVGCDCVGLISGVYASALGLNTPRIRWSFQDKFDRQVLRELEAHGFTPISKGEPGDLCVFTISGRPFHLGIYIGNAQCVHAIERYGVILSDLRDPTWAKRFVGYWRYEMV